MLARKLAMSGFRPTRSAAPYCGNWPLSEIRKVPKGTTPSSNSRNMSAPGTPARSKGTMVAL